MAELRNSTREIRKATYVPITLQPESGEGPAPKPALRALDKIAFLRALSVTPVELREVAIRGTRLPVALAAAVTGLAADPPTASTLRHAPALAGVDVATIRGLAAAVTSLRHEHDAAVTAVLQEIVTAGAAPRPAGPGFRLLDAVRRGRGLLRSTGRAAVPVVLPSAAVLAAAVHQAVAADDERIARLRALGYDVEHPQPPQRGIRAAALADAFDARMAPSLEPVGRLHLERLEMSPAGIEKGELVASVPLAPRETVNISHQEWATGSEEFEKIVQDVFEEYSETGVAEKKELSQATDSQRRHATAFTLSGSYSYAGQARVTVGYRRSSEDTQAAKDSCRESKDLTAKASARTTADHKTSFTVRSAYGTRDETVRRIHNRSDTKVMRLDYYQMMRRWRVDLLRYDVRLTYDLVIPAPGAELTAVVDEIASIDAALAEPFRFDVQPDAINETNWEELAATYGGRVSPPPLDPPPQRETEEIPSRTSSESATPLVLTLRIPIGDDVEVAAPSTFRSWFGRHDARVSVDVLGESMSYHHTSGGIRDRSWCDLDGLIGKTGDVPVIYEHRYASHGGIIIDLTLRATQAAKDRWRFETWQILHAAAEEHYFQARQVLADRREQLLAGLRGWDALTLRQLEREAIMKGVLRWILGPDFTFGPPGVDTPLGEAVVPTTAENWLGVLEYGEFAKFVHQAIEWENVLFFLYPYFWDERAETADKRLLLQHPDARHREFLRAGSARVVLTVRPGFEVDFTHLMETALLIPDPQSTSPYMPIAQEIANFARTNYPGIPPANPESNYRPLLAPQQRAAWRDMQRLMFLLDAVAEVDGQYPAEAGWFQRVRNHAAVLQAAGILDAEGQLWNPASLPATDPWGNPWRYSRPGVLADYDLATFGANNAEGGEGLDADITSWAEASLIARWYEYTPTGAMDVSINTNLDNLA